MGLGRRFSGWWAVLAGVLLLLEAGQAGAGEAGIKLGWEHYVGLEGAIVGMEGYGASAPASVLYEKFGITVEAIVQSAKELLQRT